MNDFLHACETHPLCFTCTQRSALFIQSPTVAGAKIEMASMIRHAEDKLKLKSSQGIAGRLTEVQIIQLFSELK